MMKTIPKIKLIPLQEQRFTTLGDWYEDSRGQFTIAISDMNDWRYEFIVLMHELTEWGICQARGVSTKDCDDFDARWEEDIRAGLVSPEIEAGFNKNCPYRIGHTWGARIERLFCFLLRVPWKQYCSACDEMIAEYVSDASKEVRV